MSVLNAIDTQLSLDESLLFESNPEQNLSSIQKRNQNTDQVKTSTTQATCSRSPVKTSPPTSFVQNDFKSKIPRISPRPDVQAPPEKVQMSLATQSQKSLTNLVKRISPRQTNTHEKSPNLQRVQPQKQPQKTTNSFLGGAKSNTDVLTTTNVKRKHISPN